MTATLYTDDYFATTETPVDAGDGGDLGGCDTSKAGSQIILDADGQAYKAASGGAYSSYGGAKNEGAVFIPRRTFAGGDNSTTTPNYLLAATALDGGQSMWKVTASGVTFTDVTPAIGGDKGLSVGMNCITMHWRSSSYIAALLEFGSDLHLVTSVNTGFSWSDRGELNLTAVYIRQRKADLTKKQLAMAGGSDGLILSSDFGATLKTKVLPTDDDVISAEFF